MALVRVDRKTGRTTLGPIIRIYRAGQMALSAEAYGLIGRPRYAELYVEPGKRVCIKPMAKESTHTFRVTPHPSSGAAISAGRLVREHLAGLALPIKLAATLDDGMLSASIEGAETVEVAA